jgi:adenosylhomocysteine nucleosidase
MNEVTNNKGIINFSGTQQVTGSAVGDGAMVNLGHSPRYHTPAAPESRSTWEIGIVTILATEAKAILTELGLTEDETKTRAQRFYTGRVKVLGAVVDVVATRASGPGQRAAMTALGNLRHYYDPAALVLVGIGGAINRRLAINDVVVATRVVYYDQRKVTSEGVRPRGEDRESPAGMVQAVSSFFTDHGDPAVLRVTEPTGQSVSFRVFHGPVGSGEAVIANRKSGIRKFLHAYNEKILAVDMEAGGLSQFCYDTSSADGTIPGWVVIRGISDHADNAKNDDQHASAAKNAAHTLHRMLPYLHTGVRGSGV